MVKERRKLLGFRTGKGWKKLLALLYYAMCLVVLYFALFTPVPVAAQIHDRILYRLHGLVIVVWLLSPAIFLSNTPMRRYLPLFRNRSLLASLAGMMIVFLFFAYLFAVVGEFYTPQFYQAFGTYIQEAYEAFVAAGAARG